MTAILILADAFGDQSFQPEWLYLISILIDIHLIDTWGDK